MQYLLSPLGLRDGDANNENTSHSGHNLLAGMLSDTLICGTGSWGGMGWGCGEVVAVLLVGLIARLQEFQICAFT